MQKLVGKYNEKIYVYIPLRLIYYSQNKLTGDTVYLIPLFSIDSSLQPLECFITNHKVYHVIP